MSTMPDFEWVDGPPPEDRRQVDGRASWVALAGVLSQHPGRWVRVEAPRTSMTALKNNGCEAVSRGAHVYARWPAGGDA